MATQNKNQTGVQKTLWGRDNEISRADFNASVAESDINSNEQIAALLTRAKFVPVEQLEELTGAYFELKDGETYIFFCKGLAEKSMKSLKENPAPGEEFVDAVELITDEGKDVINADIVMVSTVRKLKAQDKLPCMIQVFVDGKKGSKGSEYKNLVIHKY